MPTPTTYERFCQLAHKGAQIEQIRQLLKTATDSELREIVPTLLDKLETAELAADLNRKTIIAMCRDED